jgi:hypothetical protein
MSEAPIVYSLEGQGVGEFFTIDKYSGEISVLKPLDRDPPAGVPVWEFVVHATDEDGTGLVSYANVRVVLKDLNDHAPIFIEHLVGTVEENREPGSNGIYVMSVVATDYDDPTTENAQLEYHISVNKELDNEPVFRIDPNNGKIFLMVRF